MRSTRIAASIAAAILATMATAGCAASYEERIEFLKKTANRGVEVHRLIKSQGATPDRKRCEGAFEALNDGIPSDGGMWASRVWVDQVRMAFVESCVSGLPKPIAGSGSPSPEVTATTGSPTPTASE